MPPPARRVARQPLAERLVVDVVVRRHLRHAGQLRLAIDDEVDVALAVQQPVVAATAGDELQAELLEQSSCRSGVVEANSNPCRPIGLSNRSGMKTASYTAMAPQPAASRCIVRALPLRSRRHRPSHRDRRCDRAAFPILDSRRSGASRRFDVGEVQCGLAAASSD